MRSCLRCRPSSPFDGALVSSSSVKMNRRLDRRFSAAWPLRAPLEFVGVFLGFPALCPTPSSLFWIVSVAVSLSTETFLHDILVGSLVPFV